MATRKHMTIAEKMTVIKENENNPKISAAALATHVRKFNIETSKLEQSI